jgi:large subunit ribosomal protein L10
MSGKENYMLKSKKAEVIEQLTTSFADTTAVVICDYKGLTVSQLEELRKAARAKDTSVQVVKNTLATIALNNAGMSGVEIKDTNIFIWSDDVINAAKIASDFAKDNDKFVIKAGYLDKEPADVAKIEAFAKLPGRDELLGMLAATWMAPITNLAIGIDALRKKKEEEA